MKSKVSHQSFVFIIALIEVLVVELLLNYFITLGWSARFNGALLVINGFLLLYWLTKQFSKTVSSCRVLLWTCIGSALFLLATFLDRFPERLLSLVDTFNLLVGIFASYGIIQCKNQSTKIAIASIVVVYIICYILFIFPPLNNTINNLSK